MIQKNQVTSAEGDAVNAFNPDWDRVEALEESLREHMAEIHRLRAVLRQEPVAWALWLPDEVRPRLVHATKSASMDAASRWVSWDEAYAGCKHVALYAREMMDNESLSNHLMEDVERSQKISEQSARAMREIFETACIPNSGIADARLTRNVNGDYEDSAVKDHWQTFRDGWDSAIIYLRERNEG